MEASSLKSKCQLIQFPGEGSLFDLQTDGHLLAQMAQREKQTLWCLFSQGR